MQTVTEALSAAGQRVAGLDARVLLRSVLEVSDAALVAYPERPLSVQECERYSQLVARRAAGEPVAYLTGTREFFSLEFGVTPAVLIPRPETELLVEWALERMPRDRRCRVLDLGTGSGCVTIAIAKERPLAEVMATDISLEALAVARANASRHGVANVRFLPSDWFEALAGERFDVIVSNPPYVPAGDPHLRTGDLRFEPPAALAAGTDGLACIRGIIAAAPRHLRQGALLVIEHGYDHGSECRDLLARAGFANVCSRYDLAGMERASGGEFS